MTSNRPTDAEKGHAFILENITPAEAALWISELKLGVSRTVPDQNAVWVSGSPADLRKVAAVFDLIDAREPFALVPLAAVQDARTLPSNKQIARSLGEIVIGTFSDPPASEAMTRGIIDHHRDSIVAIVPVRFRRDLLAVSGLGLEAFAELGGQEESPPQISTQAPQASTDKKADAVHSQADTPSAMSDETQAGSMPAMSTEPEREMVEIHVPDPDTSPQAQQPDTAPADAGDVLATQTSVAVATDVQPEVAMRSAAEPDTTSGQTGSQPHGAEARVGEAADTFTLTSVPNGEEVLELDLPQTMDLINLLDLAAEYLDLDYMYEPTQITGQAITLKLHGQLQGKIRVRDLYPLLESVLKFKGFVMTRQQGKLVTVVPVEQALDVDPKLLDGETQGIEAGDVVVTRVLQLQYLDAHSAKNLLENMRLGVAVSPVEETQTLIVTCYAHRASRIEMLLRTIDRPGRPKIFRYRQLKFTTAEMLVGRLQMLTDNLQGVPITIESEPRPFVGSPQGDGPIGQSPPVRMASRSTGPQPPVGSRTPGDSQLSVYLDADERTNRIFMLGYDEQLKLVEELIEALDVPQWSLQTTHVYYMKNVDAELAGRKLEGLGLIGGGQGVRGPSVQPSSPSTPPASSAGWTFTVEGTLVEEPQIVVLESTNALLVNATEEQHAQIEKIVSYIDVSPGDLRTLQVYRIEYVDAEEVREKLEELGVIEASVPARPATGRPVAASPAVHSPDASPPVSMAVAKPAIRQGNLEGPQVVILKATNSLMVNATLEQHAKIESIISHVDSETPEDEIPYKVYQLTNSAPGHLATVLQELVQETTQNRAPGDKIAEPAAMKREEEIAIVPDPNTYSLIVYASKKNQEWIASLIQQLDKRRPQVLIDCTLVEITKSDEFSYDLNVLRSSPDIESTSGVTGATVNDNVLGKVVDWGGGGLTAFYGDEEIQVLLETMQTKNYGRVLAKPKLLVYDNQSGSIKTTDVTYVETSSSIPISTGGGENTTLVQTELNYEPYEAGITLDIVPHISEGRLLQLNVTLTRSDFVATPAVDGRQKPPNTRSNELKSTVTLPDGSTVILGGLLKMNQTKGGSKVPLLGDIPLVGGLFRSIDNEDTQSKLYVFIKAEIIRPIDAVSDGIEDLHAISERDRKAFEGHEREFQGYQNWPGIKPKPISPVHVLEAR